MLEWKQTVRSDFFLGNKLLLQPDLVFASESIGCNFSSLVPPGGEKRIIFSLAKKIGKFFSHHQVALESLNYDHSTQNRKLHQTVVTVCFWKKSPLTVTFHSSIMLNIYFHIQFKASRMVSRLHSIWWINSQTSRRHFGIYIFLFTVLKICQTKTFYLFRYKIFTNYEISY